MQIYTKFTKQHIIWMVFLVYHLRMFKKSLNISFITCFCHFIELLIPYFETATDFNSFGTKCRMP